MTFLVVAGEASGDEHGARLLASLSRSLPASRFVGIGGPAMEREGLEALHSISELSVMGFVEVIPKLTKVFSILRDVASWAERERPTAAILIDAPDFNLRLARELRHLGIPIFYLVAPMAWAWREGRVRALRDLDGLFCIYPFEEDWFRRRNVPAAFVGNPLLEDPLLHEPPDRSRCREALGLASAGEVVALLPGSRPGEIRRILPTLLQAAERLAEARGGVRFVLPLAGSDARREVESLLPPGSLPLRLVEGRATEALRAADAAVVCSGTATLQAALVHCPTVLVYRAHPLSMALVKWLVRLSHAGIVNILLGREVVPELLQEACTAEGIVRALVPLLDGGTEREEMLEAFQDLRRDLGGPGFAGRAADAIVSALPQRLT